MKKSAFTLIELVIVIVVAGILAVVMIPRMDRNNAREAANQLVGHIQYAQHLAMVDDVYDAGDNVWFQKRWAVNVCGLGYKVIRADGTQIAVDPMTRKPMDGVANSLAKFDVTMVLSGAASDCLIIFDNFGRPYRGSGAQASLTAGKLNADFTMTLSDDSDSAVVEIKPETGYTHIL